MASTAWKEPFERGMAAGAAGDLAGALPHFREAVRLAPSEPYPHYELGYTLFLLGEFDAALLELRRTNELVEGFFVVQTEIYVCEAVLSGLIDLESLTIFRTLQRLTDAGRAQSPDAVASSRALVERAPAFAVGHHCLGKALLRTDPKASEESLQQCVALGPDDTTAIDALAHIGVHRRNAGDAEAAHAIWSDTVQKYGTNPHVVPLKAFFMEIYPP